MACVFNCGQKRDITFIYVPKSEKRMCNLGSFCNFPQSRQSSLQKKKKIPAKSHVPKKTAIKQTIFIFK